MFYIVSTSDGLHFCSKWCKTRKEALEDMEIDVMIVESVDLTYKSEVITDREYYKRYPDHVNYMKVRKIHPLVKIRKETEKEFQ